MKNISGAHTPTEYSGYWDCVAHCIADAYTDNGSASVLAWVSGWYGGAAIGTLCALACDEYGPHIHY